MNHPTLSITLRLRIIVHEAPAKDLNLTEQPQNFLALIARHLQKHSNKNC